ncbi:MAG: thermonuclease family protein [Rhodospirillaceae bacterium]|jgi:endonuclease YncB( thermonuclease family)|nr:thermonuclease family protein [Rhodospirillaceae bacterium]MBT5244123.1 thermonuclease family protein [Rhodospirillaceae bacterium]MBT5561648.1 thermonuclease family protein [Rhodospirillaceae bacterium]MBT6243087.1 thermonuclease family protein [Rhodospirillaceae bacterium]MBT7138463.1 thermonuclease family protein [Rhodospirillaceae bacterium]
MARALILTLLLVLQASPAQSDEITGKGRAIDGDSLTIDGAEIRLYGIDAPELAQTCTTKKGKLQQCGDLARQMLDTLTKNVNVKCQTQTTDTDGKMAAICFAGPFDINEQMVAAGWAFPLMNEVAAYERAEKFARARAEGIWRGTFIPPAQWREQNPGQ